MKAYFLNRNGEQIGVGNKSSDFSLLTNRRSLYNTQLKSTRQFSYAFG